MKALVLKALKNPLELDEVRPREPQTGELLANVKSAALNHRDLWIKYGQYPGIVLPTILGSDGVVEVDGSEYIINPNIDWGTDPQLPSTDYRILGLEQWGTMAEQITIAKHRLHPKPDHLSIDQAASLPLAGLTAYRALFNAHKGALLKGEKVLITGVGGGVALMALQFALAAKAEVYVTSGSDEKIDRAIAMGAQGGVNYRDTEWSKKLRKAGGGFDVIVDSAGGKGFSQLVRLCNMGARIAFFGATRGPWQDIDAPRLFLKQVALTGTTMGSDTEFVQMLEFVKHHQIVPNVSQVFRLEEADRAFAMMEEGKQFGKIVLNTGYR